MLNDKPNGTYSLKAQRGQTDPLEPCLNEALLEADMATLLSACVAKIAANDPDDAAVSITRSSTTTLLEYRVGPRDQGPLIGWHGQVLKALNVLARAMMGPAMSNHTVLVNKVKDERSERAYGDRRYDDGFDDREQH
jgi:predicted RNA-binding protein YlqC (UPF0109 family)